MSHLLTFRYGGLVLEDKRSWPVFVPIANAFLPTQALVLLKQHQGRASRCVVRVGDLVREGALIGKADEGGAAAIHAPVPGIVKDIRPVRVSAGGPCSAVEILLQGNFDRLGKREERYIWTSMSRTDMIQTLRERGVVEMDEPGRPIVDMLASRKSPPILLLNCIESEPYLRTENAVLHECLKAVLEGLAILNRLLEPARTIVALEPHQEKELGEERLRVLSGIEAPVELIRARQKYPQDLPNQLLAAINGGRKKQGIGELFIIRPSTALAIYEAIVLAKPVIERFVTIAGGSIKHPAVLKARIGTPIGDLVEECGGFLGQPEKILLGGPLRGQPVHDLDAPLTKQTGAVLALTSEETNRSSKVACIRCGRCADVCPERLLPVEIYRRLDKNRTEDAHAIGLSSCTLCGACGYSCPSRLALVEAFATGQAARELRR